MDITSSLFKPFFLHLRAVLHQVSCRTSGTSKCCFFFIIKTDRGAGKIDTKLMGKSEVFLLSSCIVPVKNSINPKPHAIQKHGEVINIINSGVCGWSEY